MVYINATLAEWLGLDLTRFQPGSMAIGDLVAGEGLALIQSVQAEPACSRPARSISISSASMAAACRCG